VDVVGTARGSRVGDNDTWYQLPSGGWVSSTFISRGSNSSAASPRIGGRWIDVNLTTLRASAMVGDQAVFSTPMVSGRPGWRTPTGTFHILWRTPSRDMDSTTIGMPPGTPGYYFQPDVPWVQYFTKGGHAIHGNDWVPASAFGRENTSHGCIGMPISASKYFYDFGAVGMPVVIHY
jgi:lipoprotein-anchoring transpeptidase ErfK/SrfK